MAGAVIRLSELGAFDPGEHFEGPWEVLEVKRLVAGDDWTCIAETSESAVYVTAGTGTVAIGDEIVKLAEGTGLMFVRGSSGKLAAGDNGIELFITRVGIRAEGPLHH